MASTCPPTGKIRYRTHLDAKLALLRTSRNQDSRRPKDESRTYACPECRGWHLTALTAWRR